jgi:hypothetical protein
MAVRAVIKSTLAALTAAFVAAFFAPKAQAQLMCFDANGVKNFHAEYGEEEVARGTLGSVGEMLLLANPNTGTWTMMIVRPDKLLCPFASGNNFVLTKPVDRGQNI